MWSSIGIGMLGLAKRIPSLAVIGFAAGLLHVLNHSIFKGLLFLGAGAGSCAVTLPHPGQQRLEHSIPAFPTNRGRNRRGRSFCCTTENPSSLGRAWRSPARKPGQSGLAIAVLQQRSCRGRSSRACIRKPSYLISCSHSSPFGTSRTSGVSCGRIQSGKVARAAAVRAMCDAGDDVAAA